MAPTLSFLLSCKGTCEISRAIVLLSLASGLFGTRTSSELVVHVAGLCSLDCWTPLQQAGTEHGSEFTSKHACATLAQYHGHLHGTALHERRLLNRSERQKCLQMLVPATSQLPPLPAAHRKPYSSPMSMFVEIGCALSWLLARASPGGTSCPLYKPEW